MSLFPEAKFAVRLPATGIVPGTRLDGKLIVTVPAEIPRAERIELFFRTDARVHYSGSNQVYERALFVAPLRVELDRTRPLPAGTHSYPFSIEIPPWLPPAYFGSDCGIEHVFQVRLDVDWASDPKAVLAATVVLSPVEADARSVTTRSRPDFYENLVIDVVVDRNTLVHGEPVTGVIALRGGRETNFESIRLSFVSLASMVMAQGEKRRGTAVKSRIPAARLRTGETIPFELRFPPNVPPSFRTGFIDHDVVLAVDVETTWSVVSGFYVPLRIVPAGSTVHSSSTEGPIALGSERLAGLARAVAEETGFAVGRLPIFASGRVGPMSVYIADGPREGRIGLDIEMEFPDLELGIVYRPLGVLEGFRQSPFLPPGLAASHFLRVDPARAEGGEIPVPVPDEALEDLFDTIFHGLDSRNEVRLSDHHFGLHLVLRGDGRDDVVEAARWTKERAEAISREIGRLPFAALHPDAEAAWRATAREEKAFLLPHVPALHGITIAARVMGGESRVLGVTLRTRRDKTIAADLDLRAAPLPAGADIAAASAVIAVFPRYRIHSLERVTLEGADFAPDPRRLLAVLETFLGWLVETRGEKRTDSPYR